MVISTKEWDISADGTVRHYPYGIRPFFFDVKSIRPELCPSFVQEARISLLQTSLKLDIIANQSSVNKNRFKQINSAILIYKRTLKKEREIMMLGIGGLTLLLIAFIASILVSRGTI